MSASQILEKLNWRYAVKQFDSSKKITDDELSLVKETLRLSPSSFGLQPWKFLFIKDENLRQKVREKAWGQAQVTDASELIVLCRPSTLEENHVDELIQATAQTRGATIESLAGYSKVIKGFLANYSDEQKNFWMEKQIYIALGDLMTVCAMQNIDTCPMEGFDRAGVDDVLDLKAKGLNSVVLCPIGHRSNEDKYATAAKVRYSMDKVIEVI